MIGSVMIEMVHSEDRARTQKMASQVMAGHSMTHFENRYVRKDGQIVLIMWSARWSEADQLRIAVAHDITERKHVESAMTHFDMRFVRIVGQIVLIMWSACWSEADHLRIAVAHDITERKHVES